MRNKQVLRFCKHLGMLFTESNGSELAEPNLVYSLQLIPEGHHADF